MPAWRLWCWRVPLDWANSRAHLRDELDGLDPPERSGVRRRQQGLNSGNELGHHISERIEQFIKSPWGVNESAGLLAEDVDHNGAVETQLIHEELIRVDRLDAKWGSVFLREMLQVEGDDLFGTNCLGGGKHMPVAFVVRHRWNELLDLLGGNDGAIEGFPHDGEVLGGHFLGSAINLHETPLCLGEDFITPIQVIELGFGEPEKSVPEGVRIERTCIDDNRKRHASAD